MDLLEQGQRRAMKMINGVEQLSSGGTGTAQPGAEKAGGGWILSRCVNT